ncbi:hypothetical protein KAFR_0C03150 [Kazachstania africana CBS 2517]|uniref:Uncharacterized protein n=1 Tax=Kazachstania africana (strain ATCC 22294 / BCRC 22015 / CBS 2517 / CECT 1963 / NBRC 1671 / NRRL Y-8276) TaxID=1071382 RepID=H2ASF7_KAZAF|nr:hypothetical protein KAFR_0C03150 [Kazachstania africana CBS 2517]CCF57307.1 hypothetical protein KAFR_0C03150 [Kazachstania africana CBS 2517]
MALSRDDKNQSVIANKLKRIDNDVKKLSTVNQELIYFTLENIKTSMKIEENGYGLITIGQNIVMNWLKKYEIPNLVKSKNNFNSKPIELQDRSGNILVPLHFENGSNRKNFRDVSQDFRNSIPFQIDANMEQTMPIVAQTTRNIVIVKEDKKKNLFEKMFGEYCPIFLRTSKKYYNYDSIEHKRLQIELAVRKFLEQDGKFFPKRVYNPGNKEIHWLVRPFHWENEIQYDDIVSEAIDSDGEWKPRHSGIQIAPRKHFFRAWLNRKWEWDIVRDFIFQDLAPRPLNEETEIYHDATEHLPNRSQENDQHNKSINEMTESELLHILDAEDFGEFNSRNSSLIEDVFNSLISICKSPKKAKTKPLNRSSPGSFKHRMVSLPRRHFSQ